MTNAQRIIQAIGRRAIVAAIGVGSQRVRQVEISGKAPASWARIIIDLAEEHGVAVTSDDIDEMFDWRPRGDI